MHRTDRISAIRWKLDCQTETNSGVKDHIRTSPTPSASEYVDILRKSNLLYKNARSLIATADRIYREDIERRESSHGRTIDISMPVRYSSSILNLAELVQSTDTKLFRLQASIEELASDAKFDVSTIYEETARLALKKIRDLVEIADLYIHTHLWLSWTIESLSQINRIHHLITETDQYTSFDSEDIAYIAHPPIMVTTIACTALIEEVGGNYIDYYSEKHINLDNTSSSVILDHIRELYDRSSEFDLEGIDGVLIETRNTLVHYIKSRHQSLKAEDFDEYSKLVMETIGLSKSLIESMANEALKEYASNVIATGIEHSTDEPVRQRWIRFFDERHQSVD